jgi:SAM-dependent methyltransferase
MDERIYHLPEEYDLEHTEREPDIDFYIALARRWRPKRILELGCGTGRVTIPLAESVGEFCESIVGLDLEPTMLVAARRKAARFPEPAKRIKGFDGDMRTWRSEEPFDLIIAPCSVLCHLLTIEDQLNAWKIAFLNLNNGGRLIADVNMADYAVFAESLQNPPRAIVQIDNDTTRSRAGDHKRLVRYKTVVYRVAEQHAAVRHLYDAFSDSGKPNRFISDYESHVYYPRELELLFRMNGFAVESQWGDYREGPLGNSSRVHVVVGLKQSGARVLEG